MKKKQDIYRVVIDPEIDRRHTVCNEDNSIILGNVDGKPFLTKEQATIICNKLNS